MEPMPPHVLREYALVADGERGALVGPRGEFVWMCFPAWHDDAVFAALVGGAGFYAVTPAETFVWGGYYERGLIWCSRWVTRTGIVECREALALPGRREQAVILRRVVAVQGDACVDVVLDPAAAFGARRLTRMRQSADGAWTGRTGDIRVLWQGAETAEPRRDGDGRPHLAMRLLVPAGAHHDLVLTLAAGAVPEPPHDADAAWRATELGWREVVPELKDSIAPRDARHALAVLTGLTSRSGAMVAAATMGLPERAEAGRNYDYRYAWIRDQCYAGQAVARCGAHRLLDDTVGFVGALIREHGERLAPAYTVDGDPVPPERRLKLPGYPGGADIAGNWVRDQFQLDAFGEALLLFATAAELDHLDADGWRSATLAADAIERRWREPDAGIWELDPDEWTHSRLISVAGLRAIAMRPHAPRAPQWLALADAVLADTAARCVHPEGRWQRSPSDERVDAALLLAAIRGATDAEDPRALATLAAVMRDLTEDGYCYRYRIDARPLGDAEGAFVLCGFLLALAHHQRGDRLRAARWFERNRAVSGPPGLLSEEFDVTQRQLRANLPQAFVHALLLECALTLEG
jgi:hypothetical protein